MADSEALQALLDADFAPVQDQAPTQPTPAPAVASPAPRMGDKTAPVDNADAPFTPEIAAILSGVNKANLGANALLYKTGEGITSLGGVMPNPLANFMHKGAADAINKWHMVDEGNRGMGGEDHPVLGMLGSMATLPNIALSKIPGGSNALKAGLITGTAGGALNPDPNESPDSDLSKFFAGRALQAGYGGIGGGVLGGLAHLASGVIAPGVQKGVETLKKYGSDLSKYSVGQLLGGMSHAAENYLKDVDVLKMTGAAAAQERGAKEFAMTPIRHSLDSIGEKPDTSGSLQGAFQDAQRKIGAVYEDSLAKMPPIKVSYDDLNNFNQAVQSKLAGLKGHPELHDRFVGLMNNLASAVENNGHGVSLLNPKAINSQASDLGKESRAFYGRKDPLTLHEGKYAEAVMDVKNKLKQLLYGNDASGNLQAADRAFAQLQAPQAAASAAKRAGGEYTPDQLINAATRKQSDKSIAAGTNFYQDLGQAGQQTLGDLHSDGWKKAAEILGTLSTTGAAAWANPATTALAAGIGIPALRVGASEPVQGVLARYITSQGPIRKGAGKALDNLPRFTGMASPALGKGVTSGLDIIGSEGE